MAPAQKLYTLTEVSKATGISMPTLQRYKKLYQERIPSVGEGRKQRYPQKALAVFKKIRDENLKKRGRRSAPRRAASGQPKGRRRAKGKAKASARKKTAGKKTATKKKARKTSAARKPKASARRKKTAGKTAAGGENLLTLLEIGRRTGISYPTLLRYVKLYGDEIPSVGSGRRRRYPVAAVKEFRRLRRASKRGPRAGAKRAASTGARRATGTDRALQARVRELERAQRQVTKQLDEIVRLLKKPMRITVRSD